MYKGYPEFAFLLWASGAADEQCAADMDLPIPKWQRVFWNIRGSVLCFLFGWWWWVKDTRAQQSVHPTKATPRWFEVLVNKFMVLRSRLRG